MGGHPAAIQGEVRRPADEFFDLLYHHFRLFCPGSARGNADKIPFWTMASQGFRLLHQGGGAVQNRLGGAVVLIEGDLCGPGEVLYEAVKILDVGAAKAVYGLVWVANRTNNTGNGPFPQCLCQSAGLIVRHTHGMPPHNPLISLPLRKIARFQGVTF